MAPAALAPALLPASLCLAVAAAAYMLLRNQKRASPLREGGKIKRILMYPFKSLPAIEVSSADIQIEGVAYKNLRDR